ncbi:hypothetical protein D3C72_2105460 [compost metagenome]
MKNLAHFYFAVEERISKRSAQRMPYVQLERDQACGSRRRRNRVAAPVTIREQEVNILPRSEPHVLVDRKLQFHDRHIWGHLANRTHAAWNLARLDLL